MRKTTRTELRQLKGVGTVLARRLSDGGLDSFDKIVRAGEGGLQAIPGVGARKIGIILTQAGELSREGVRYAPKAKAKKELAGAPLAAPEAGEPAASPDQVEECNVDLEQQAAGVRDHARNLAREAEDRFAPKLGGKAGKKLSADLVRIEDALRALPDGHHRSRRAGKAMKKAEKRLTGLEGGGLKRIRKGIRRARKALDKAI
ncbi:helix-hairpin-helix domain-containing protein [Geomonas sp. Red32]|uniref:helix-hairpin-helix domain-containing protein n=1 Tax=Geomonas sp. Red32 TaxID=2912856 RepID=UPI00202CF785|nr:helix-hairpin-helix domain-containing protein [Geomonas sp. Red32]MCM0081397.1 helix-hairpin-helix domain-containing protein [Geomonas sp. Red32]